MSELIQRLKKHEGLMLKPYIDTVGKLTIGYGRNLDDVGITEEEAELLLRHDIMVAESACCQFAWYRGLDEKRKSVIVEMVFNLGLTRLLGFKKMIRAIKDADYKLASNEMLDSKWAYQVGNRAITLSNIMHG